MSSPGNANTVDPLNRAQLMDDAATFAEVGLVDWVTALSTTKYLDQESQLVPWTVATYVLEYIRDRVYQTAEGVQLFQVRVLFLLFFFE